MDRVKIKQPAPPGTVARVPVVMQMEALECGAAALNMVLSYYGRFVPPARLRKELGVSRDGSTIKNIVLAAKSYGLETQAWRCDIESLKTKCPCPCILYWQHRHFIVLNGCKKDKFYINDPACGYVVMTREQLSRGYSGLCVTFKPGSGFESGGQRDSMLSFALKRLKRAGAMSAMIILTTLILTLLGLIEPAFTRTFVDYILPQRAPGSLTTVFFTAFGFFALAKLLVLWIRGTYLVKLQGKMAIYSGSSFIWKLLRLPVDFFNQRHPGDIIKRYNSNTTIAFNIIMKHAPLALDFCALIFYFLLMTRYSPALAAVGLLTVVLNTGISLVLAKKRLNAARMQLKNNSILAATSMAGLGMIESIKAGGAEMGFFEQWADVYAACGRDKTELGELKSAAGSLPELISALSDSLILCLGIICVIKGEWTIGLVSAFAQYLNAFSAPARQLADALASFQETKSDAERINDVMEYDTNENDKGGSVKTADIKKLSGEIELKNITFGYNKLREPIIKDFNLKLRAGERVALVGGSGSGKSTIAGILTGLNKPWSGEVLYDGIPIENIDRAVFTAYVAAVDQQIMLFKDSIKNNISMWDITLPEDDIVRAARDAQIYDGIILRENGFMTEISENGKNMSGGERQRLELARALAGSPSVLILDEATSALDAETEFRVMNAVKERNISCIAVSHRLSTVRDCDQIVVLEGGSVLAQGTHAELVENCEYYRRLITSE